MELVKTTERVRTTERELAHRINDGIHVTLLWNEDTGALTVTVLDAKTGAAFEIPAEPQNALEAFNHPYAYAAFTGAADEPRLAA